MPVKKVIIDKANRIYQIPPDLKSFYPGKRKSSLLKKAEQIDLASFNWPIGPDAEMFTDPSKFAQAGADKINKLKEVLAEWFNSYHNARINPHSEIFIGSGISSILFTLSLAFIDHGDLVFVPEIGIPTYKTVTAACGAQPVNYQISPKNEWTPDFEKVHSRLGRVARLLFLNNPHNPTGAEFSVKDFENLVWIAGKDNISIIVDAAYQSIPARKQVSLMSIPGGKKIGVEIYSFPYQFGMPAIPFGFAVGSKDIIIGLHEASRLVKPFIPEAYVDIAIRSIRQYPNQNIRSLRQLLTQKTAMLTEVLELLSLEKSSFDTTPFVWAKIKRRSRSVNAANMLFKRSRIIVTPGTAFGDSGEGYLRFSLTAETDAYRHAFERVQKKLRFLKLDKE